MLFGLNVFNGKEKWNTYSKQTNITWSVMQYIRWWFGKYQYAYQPYANGIQSAAIVADIFNTTRISTSREVITVWFDTGRISPMAKHLSILDIVNIIKRRYAIDAHTALALDKKICSPMCFQSRFIMMEWLCYFINPWHPIKCNLLSPGRSIRSNNSLRANFF